MKQYRHGDVFLCQVTPPPETGRINRPNNVLAEGEITGHAHRVKGEHELYERDGKLYLRVRNRATVVHEDHAQIVLSPGTYEVTHQREWSPEGERQVQD